MKIVIFGLTITSAWGNGHATTFRSLVKALARRGHQVTFVEKDVEWYRDHRDLPSPEFCRVQLYDDWLEHEAAFKNTCADADAIVIGSYFPDAQAATRLFAEAGFGPLLFYDIDTPVTLAALRCDGKADYLDAALIPLYNAYLSFSGGAALQELESRFGARRALPFYCSVDPDIYKPSASLEEFCGDLSYLGTYAPDRQPKLMQLLNAPAAALPGRQFVVAGAMYPEGTGWRANVRRFDHVAPAEHPAFYSSSRFSLNLTREDMVAMGHSPSVRLFEASACGAAILSDDWKGMKEFFTPGDEILIPRDDQDVVDILLHTSDAERARIGGNARERTLAHHTATQRAIEFEAIISELGTTTTRPAATVPRATTAPGLHPQQSAVPSDRSRSPLQ